MSRQPRRAHDQEDATHKAGSHAAQELADAKPTIDVMLTQFCCHDDSFTACQEGEHRMMSWKLDVRGNQPIVIELLGNDREASVKINGTRVLPKDGRKESCVLEDDFEYQWPPIPGDIRGLHENGFFEVQPGFGCTGGGLWHPATLLDHREDGDFDVLALMPNPDGNMPRQVAHPGVSSSQLRVKETLQPPELRQYSMKLRVPKQDPRRATILLDGLPISRMFTRPTPASSRLGSREKGTSKVRLQVDRFRSSVTADVGHSIFGHFLTSEPRNVSSTSESMKKTWTLQIGPFIEHVIVLEKRFVSSDIISLTVDGVHLVEASAKDLQCNSKGFWECNFCFVGERVLEFELYEENWMGLVLDTKGIICQRLPTVVRCCTTLEIELGIKEGANLIVDGEDFSDLRHMSEKHPEPAISMEPETLFLQYDVNVPHRLSEATTKGQFRSWGSWMVGALARLGIHAHDLASEVASSCHVPSLAVPAMATAMTPSDFGRQEHGSENTVKPAIGYPDTDEFRKMVV